MLLHDADGPHQQWRLTCLRHQVRGTVRVCRRGYEIRRGLWRGHTYISWEGLPMLSLGGNHASWRNGTIQFDVNQIDSSSLMSMRMQKNRY